jgi:hypothetical protein
MASVGKSASHFRAGLVVNRTTSGHSEAGRKRPFSTEIEVVELITSPVANISTSLGRAIGPSMLPSARWMR